MTDDNKRRFPFSTDGHAQQSNAHAENDLGVQVRGAEDAEEELTSELTDYKQLQEISCRLIPTDDIEALYEELVTAAVDLTGADGGTMQSLDADTGELHLLVAQGMPEWAIDAFARITPELCTSCTEAMQRGERVIIADYRTDEEFAGTESAQRHLEAGIRAVQSTPLISRSGHMVGILSTHWNRPHEPDERTLRLLDILARQAADLIEQRRSEQALRESEKRYRTLFNSIDEGFCVIEVLFDASEEPVDFRYLETNPAFEEHTGLAEAEGKRIRELTPDIEERWFNIYGEVARTGEPVRLNCEADSLDRHFDLYAFRIGDPAERKVAVLFSNVTEKQKAEEALRESEKQLAAELAATRRLQEISTHLIQKGDIDALYQEVLDAAVAIMGSDFASLQMFDPDRGELQLLAHREFSAEAAAFWERVDPEASSTCAAALGSGQRVIASDVETCEFMAGTEDREIYLQTGIRAVQSTPLLSRSGHLLGIISTHWRAPHKPAERDLRLLDVLARQAADLIERTQSEEELRKLNETLEERVARRTEQVRKLASRLTMAEQTERHRIAELLHDDLQQRLYGIQMRMTFLRKHATDDGHEQLLEEVRKAEALMNEAITTVRQLSVDLSPPVLKKDGLVDALSWLKTQMKELYELEVEIEAAHAFHLHDENMHVLLFHLARDLILRVAQYAETNRATVTLTDSDDEITICVRDEGRGFNPAEVEKQSHEGRFGLTAARERLDLFGGRLEVESAPGEDTCVTAHVPLPPTDHVVPQEDQLNNPAQ